jgi:hypothetical protein
MGIKIVVGNILKILQYAIVICLKTMCMFFLLSLIYMTVYVEFSVDYEKLFSQFCIISIVCYTFIIMGGYIVSVMMIWIQGYDGKRIIDVLEKLLGSVIVGSIIFSQPILKFFYGLTNDERSLKIFMVGYIALWGLFILLRIIIKIGFSETIQKIKKEDKRNVPD